MKDPPQPRTKPSFLWFFGTRRNFEEHVIAHLHSITHALERIMTALSDLQDKVAAIKSSLAGIRQDITDIKNGLPASGGIDAAGVESLRVALDEVVTDAAGLDAENPTPTP